MTGKYPRSFHLPWSPGRTRDDRVMRSVDGLLNCAVVITEKMDGSNVCLTSTSVFARSHSGTPNHPSFNRLKAIHASIRSNITDGLQIFAEWTYAVHSIRYEMLPTYLWVIGVREKARWLSWEDTEIVAEMLGLRTVPVLLRATFNSSAELREAVERLGAASGCFGEREGIVVRTQTGFPVKEFSTRLGKYVRSGHVQTDQHWMHRPVEVQLLKQ